MGSKPRYTLGEAHLHFAKSINGEVWGLLDQGDRTKDDNERMLAAAFASHYHWLYAGNQVHRQRGEYMIARVYLALDNITEALSHAKHCLDLTDQFKDQMEDFDFAFAFEMFARTNAANGNNETARKYQYLAQMAGNKIKDDEDRTIFFADFQAGSWYGLQPD